MKKLLLILLFIFSFVVAGTRIPIELEDFDFNGHNKEGVNKIYWATTTETNNDFFTLERDRAGEFWEEINTKQGAGNSNTRILYQYDDKDYIKGVNYYRLTQTDFNGLSETFPIISINNL